MLLFRLSLWRLAARNLTRNPRRTASSLTALAVGLSAMVAMRGFINGQHRLIHENVIEGQLGALQVHRRGYVANVLASPLSLAFDDTPALRRALGAVPGVTAIA